MRSSAFVGTNCGMAKNEKFRGRRFNFQRCAFQNTSPQFNSSTGLAPHCVAQVMRRTRNPGPAFLDEAAVPEEYTSSSFGVAEPSMPVLSMDRNSVLILVTSRLLTYYRAHVNRQLSLLDWGDHSFRSRRLIYRPLLIAGEKPAGSRTQWAGVNSHLNMVPPKLVYEPGHSRNRAMCVSRFPVEAASPSR